MGRRHLPGLLLACVALLPAVARAEAMVARYDVQAAGMTIMQVEVLLDLDGPRYLVRTRVRARGMVGWLSGGDQTTSAEGGWRGTEPVPTHYRTEGRWRGDRRFLVMDWSPSGMPQLRAVEPPLMGEHEPVPEALRQGTMDSLSALAKLTRTVARTGRCDGSAAVFDGRRRANVTMHTISLDTLPAGEGFAGQALRCAFESQVIAGFRANQDPAEARRPQPATAWIGRPLPGAGPLPVRIELPSRWFGTLRVLLTGVEPAGDPRDASGAVAEQRR